MGIDIKRIGYALAAPVLAIAFALLLTSILLIATGIDPWSTYSAMIEYGSRPRTQVNILNSATTYYLSAVAVAIGFRMNLFNIGVDGQYRLAAMIAAAFAGFVHLPVLVSQIATIAIAMLVGAMWAGIAGLLRAYRGVSEVISTIMLNFIATAVVAYLLTPGRLAESVPGSNNISTPPIPESGQVGGIALIPNAGIEVYGFLLVAILVGVGYWFLMERTRFGFDLRATGRSQSAAVRSGVNVKRMIVTTMLLSGAVAGLVGMPQLLGSSHAYGIDFPAGLGFTGIGIALIGRNNPIGIAFGALLWAFLDQSAQILDLKSIAKEVVLIMQGITVLSVVVAYEVLRRYRIRQVAAEASRQLARRSDETEVSA